MVDDVKDIQGRDNPRLLTDADRSRYPEIPNISRGRASRIAPHASGSILQVAVAVVVRAGSDVVGPTTLQRSDCRGFETQGQLDDAAQHKAMASERLTAFDNV